VTLDEGSFTVTRGGAPVGREEFASSASPRRQRAYVARALGAYGERRVSPALQTDSLGVPQRYQVEVRVGGQLEQAARGPGRGGRFAAQATTQRGESSREYLQPAGGVLIDDEAYHQWFVLGLRGRMDTLVTLPALAPRRNAQRTYRVVSREATRLAVGAATLDATHLVLGDLTSALRGLARSCRSRAARDRAR
jgi:hypothetical protein